MGMSGALKGMLVALGNTLVVAFCIAVGIDDGRIAEATMIISMMGFFPAIIIGGVLGHVAESAQKRNRIVLLVSMICVACSAVAFLGTIFDLSQLIFVSCIPTIAACSILERWTRAKPEPFPLARVA